MAKKRILSPEQKLMKAIYGKPIEDMNEEENKAAYQKAYDQVLTIFSIGYQLGWNDRKAVEEA